MDMHRALVQRLKDHRVGAGLKLDLEAHVGFDDLLDDVGRNCDRRPVRHAHDDVLSKTRSGKGKRGR